MVKPLIFKGEKKPKSKKRKLAPTLTGEEGGEETNPSNPHNLTTHPRPPPYSHSPHQHQSQKQNQIPQDNDDDNAEENWVSAESPNDLIGPVLLILLPNSSPPPSSFPSSSSPSGPSGPAFGSADDPPQPQLSCIACDQNGKVFASLLENVIEGKAETAEPHDVRQVWVASGVGGSGAVGEKGIGGEEGGEKGKGKGRVVSFKGFHGRYLTCSSSGHLSATQEAISPEESFLCTTTSPSLSPSDGIPPPTFTIQSHLHTTFLSLVTNHPPEIRAVASTSTATTTITEPNTTTNPNPNNTNPNNTKTSTALHIRMQARFKPKLKASRDSKAREKVSRRELEEAVGRRLDEEEVRKLKRARVDGSYHEAVLDVRVKGKHDKYA